MKIQVPSLMITGLSSLVAAAEFTEVTLTPPLNWLAGSYLFPVNIIAGYHAGLDEYNSTDWAAYVLAQCESYSACTSAISYQGTNSGSTGGRYWFGEVFRGGATNESFYQRDADSGDNVTDSTAWTIVE